ncbi:MAG TPA: YceD family protein [Mycobacteriales bacterium]
MRTLRRQVPAPAGLGVELIAVPQGATVDLDLRLESVMEGVLVSGTATAPVRGECGRCLESFDDEVVVDVQELFAYPESATDMTSEEDEVPRLRGDMIDLEPVLRNEVVLALPTNPLCRDDCAGLCSECGARWEDLPADHSHEQVDPRWAALQSLVNEPPPAADGEEPPSAAESKEN